MLNSQVLDVAIGLVLLYFFLSLLCSVVIEAICGLTKKRPRMLKDGILSLINDPKVLEKLYEQPLFIGNTAPKNVIKSILHSIVPFLWFKKRFPSYISSSSFVLSLLESLKQHPDVIKRTLMDVIPPPGSAEEIEEFAKKVRDLPKGRYMFVKRALTSLLESVGNDSAKAFEEVEKWYTKAVEQACDFERLLDDLKDEIPQLDSVESIRGLVSRLPTGNTIRKALIPLLESAEDRLDGALGSMEKWYDEAMERVTGWYKRYSQFFALIMAFLVALAMNADTFAIGRAIYRDQSMRASLAAMAGQVSAAAGHAGTNATVAASSAAIASSAPAGIKGREPVEGLSAAPAAVPAHPKKARQEAAKDAASPGLDERIETLRQYSEQLSSLNLCLGWTAWFDRSKKELEGKGIYDPERDTVKYWGLLCFWLAALPPALPGMAVTALLVSLGSSFWFELLGMLINVRNAGKKPLTRDEKETASRRAGG